MSNHTAKVLNFLQKNIRYSYNAPTIYRHLNGKIPLNTIRQILRRLTEEKKIIKLTRGFYQGKVNSKVLKILEKPPTLLHAITIKCNSLKLQKRGEGAKRSCDNFDEWFKFNHFKFVRYNKNGSGGMWTRRFWVFEDRDCTVTVHGNGTVELFIGCSKHPINYLEFRDIYNNVMGRIDFLSPFVDSMITQIGINKDYKLLELDGVRSLRLQEYCNAWFQIYKKESIGVVRFESHVAPRLGLRDAFLILEGLSSGKGDYDGGELGYV